MCTISHSHFFSIMLFVLPFRTEHSTYFILSKVCHFVARLKHKQGYRAKMHALLISQLLYLLIQSPKSNRPKMTDVVPLVECLLKKLDNYSHLVMFIFPSCSQHY